MEASPHSSDAECMSAHRAGRAMLEPILPGPPWRRSRQYAPGSTTAGSRKRGTAGRLAGRPHSCESHGFPSQGICHWDPLLCAGPVVPAAGAGAVGGWEAGLCCPGMGGALRPTMKLGGILAICACICSRPGGCQQLGMSGTLVGPWAERWECASEWECGV